jgi:hypothetical protein
MRHTPFISGGGSCPAVGAERTNQEQGSPQLRGAPRTRRREVLHCDAVPQCRRCVPTCVEAGTAIASPEDAWETWPGPPPAGPGGGRAARLWHAAKTDHTCSPSPAMDPEWLVPVAGTLADHSRAPGQAQGAHEGKRFRMSHARRRVSRSPAVACSSKLTPSSCPTWPPGGALSPDDAVQQRTRQAPTTADRRLVAQPDASRKESVAASKAGGALSGQGTLRRRADGISIAA